MAADFHEATEDASPEDGAEDELRDTATTDEIEARFNTKLERLRQQFEEQEEERSKLLAGTKIIIELQPKDARVLLQELEDRTVRIKEEEKAMLVILAELRAEVTKLRQRAADSVAAHEACQDAMVQTEMERTALREALREAEDREILASQKARDMVTADAVERSLAEAKEVRQQLVEQEEETSKLREALVTSWASRAEEDVTTTWQSVSDLEGVEQTLTGLVDMQQSAAAEVHHLQQLERSEAALQAKIAAACEQKAMLQSAHVDLANQGQNLREAVQAQSDRFVQRVGGLAEAKKGTNAERAKLMKMIGEHQDKLERLSAEIGGIPELEGRHHKLESACMSLEAEISRLRDMNGALGAALMGDAAPMNPDMKAIMRVLDGQKQLTLRVTQQSDEKERLLTKIRKLEKEALQSSMQSGR